MRVRRGSRSIPRFDRGLVIALIALAAFLAASLHAPLHLLEHADGGSHRHLASSTAEHPVPETAPHCHHAPRGESTPEEPPREPHDEHDCVFCQIAGEARAPLGIDPAAPPRPDESDAAPVPALCTIPAASILLAASPRAPPSLV